DTDFARVPRAKGGTAPGMGFLLAYNLLSSSVTNLRLYPQPQSTYRGAIGGLGRRGAQRIIIFETDGAPNDDATATIVNKGADSYYPIRLYNPGNYSDSKNVEWPKTDGSWSDTPVFDTIKQICALETASPPGFGTKRKPVYIYPIGYGSIFDPSNPSEGQNRALNFLQSVAFYGNTAKTTAGTDFPDNRRIYGTNEQRIDRMQKAFEEIMQYGVQVSLLE
ncbi:MAG: hypothetical protein NZM29_02205, partial [Nitrospira sp.]|nr:hypothetical protein [Nitrospira sp.]